MLVLVVGNMKRRKDENGHAQSDFAQSQRLRIQRRLHDVENRLPSRRRPLALQQFRNRIHRQQNETLPFRKSGRKRQNVPNLELLALVAFLGAELGLRDERREIDQHDVVSKREVVVVVGEPERRRARVLLDRELRLFSPQRHLGADRVRVRRRRRESLEARVDVLPGLGDENEAVLVRDRRVARVERDSRVANKADRQRAGSELDDEAGDGEGAADQNVGNRDGVNVLDGAVEVHVVPGLIVDVGGALFFFFFFCLDLCVVWRAANLILGEEAFFVFLFCLFVAVVAVFLFSIVDRIR